MAGARSESCERYLLERLDSWAACHFHSQARNGLGWEVKSGMYGQEGGKVCVMYMSGLKKVSGI
jgi:hypothetical protein